MIPALDPRTSVKPKRHATAPAATVRYLGHACFEVAPEHGPRILIDPYLTGNPDAPLAIDELPSPDLLLITHAAPDHLGDALRIARTSACRILCDPAVDHHLKAHGVPEDRITRMVWGFAATFGGVTVRAVESHHHSMLRGDGPPVTGMALGFMVTLADGTTLYHPGDTSIFGDLKLFGSLYEPDIAFLPVGHCPGSMAELSPEEAALAAAWLGVKQAVPMHYPQGDDAPYRFQAAARAKAPDVAVTLLRPGRSMPVGGSGDSDG